MSDPKLDEQAPQAVVKTIEARRPVLRSTREYLQMDFGSQAPGAEDLTIQEQVRRWCQEALEARGRIAGLVAIARVADAYNNMNVDERHAFFRMLGSDFSVDRYEVDEAIDAFREAEEPCIRELNRLTMALDSPRLQLFRQFNTIPESIKFLVDLRADISARLKQDPELWLLEFELRHLLESWFNLGFLKLHRITWDSPARLLEKLVEYEAVHEINNWMDLKRRLGSDRACFAFIHPNMPAEPIIFVEVALVRGITSNVHEVLGPDATHLQPHQADTAVFYSITNAQRGLRGIPFGNMLIKKVTAQLRGDVPGLSNFATLSPIPRLRSNFLTPLLRNGGMERFYTGDEATRLLEVVGADNLFGAQDLSTAVSELLGRPEWFRDNKVSEALRPGLLRAAKRYLTEEQSKGRLACPVANFHAGNGALLGRINWQGDTSPKGMDQSAGIMVNYVYELDHVEQCQNEYSQTGRLPMGPEVVGL